MAEKIKITIQDKFAATIALVRGLEPQIEWSSADAVEFLEDRAEKAKSKPRERKVKPEVAEFRERVAEFVANQAEPVTAKEVGAALDESTQKASAALRFLVTEGKVVAHDGEKARDAKTYETAR
jgi:predicted Rossmann fold nucleotide-binding protein DprA/Smf involved in DNA uptake